MKISDVTKFLEEQAPLQLQETYDNSGLQTGSGEWDAKGILCTIDVTEEVIDEAIRNGDNLIIAHHPVIFKDLRTLTDRSWTERVLVKAIRNEIAIYVAHTNLDNVYSGVNNMICTKMGLADFQILKTGKNELVKLVTFVPSGYADAVRNALFAAGAGHIGNYDSCSYNVKGQGTFRAGDGSNPFTGEIGKTHFEEEVRIETIVPRSRLVMCIAALTNSHPYEEVAYDVYPVENSYQKVGSGMTGILQSPLNHDELMILIKKIFNTSLIRYSGKQNTTYKKIAVCGGSGFFLLKDAIRAKADVFITSDVKYHQFFETEGKILICDIGHYESEQFTKDIFYHLLKEKFSTFAVHLSKIVTNPIKYFT